MFNISLYLEKFKSFGLGERAVKQAVCQAIKEVLNLDLTEEDVTIRQDEALLKVSPAVRSAIFIKKQQIIDKIKAKGLSAKISDLR